MKPCYKLPLNFPYLRSDIDYNNPPDWRTAHPDGNPDSWALSVVHTDKYLSDTVIQWLADKTIIVDTHSLLFRGPPGQSVFIHSDGDKSPITDNWSQMSWGINYVWGSNSHHMIWYDVLDEYIHQDQIDYTPANNPYVRYQPHQVREVYREQLDGFCLTRNDIPHSVVNHDTENVRWCLSVRATSPNRSWQDIMRVFAS